MTVFQSHSPFTTHLAGFHGENSQGSVGLQCLNPMVCVLHQAGKLSTCCAALTFDQSFYLMAYRIKEENRHEFQNMSLRLGGFYKLMSLLGAGCKLMEHWKEVDSKVYGQLSVPETLCPQLWKGKAYSNTLRASLLTYAALHCLSLQTTPGDPQQGENNDTYYEDGDD